MAKAPPSFTFFYNDWIGGTYHLTHIAKSCYLDLLIYQWQNGCIPRTTRGCMAACHITDQGQWDHVWEEIGDKFEPIDDDRRGNVRMHLDRETAIELYKKRCEVARINGRKGGRDADSKPTSVSVGTEVGSDMGTEVGTEVGSEMGFSQNPSGNPIEEEGRRKKEEGIFQEEDYLKTTHTHRTELNNSRRAVSNQTRFSDEPVERETAFKAPSSPPPAISPRESTPVSTGPTSNALAGIVGDPVAQHDLSKIQAEVIQLWNGCEGVREVRGFMLSGERIQRLRDCLKRPGWLEDFREACLTRFPLRCSGGGSSGWKPDLTWILEPENLERVLEGAYDFEFGGSGSGVTKLSKADQSEAEHQEWLARIASLAQKGGAV